MLQQIRNDNARATQRARFKDRRGHRDTVMSVLGTLERLRTWDFELDNSNRALRSRTIIRQKIGDTAVQRQVCRRKQSKSKNRKQGDNITTQEAQHVYDVKARTTDYLAQHKAEKKQQKTIRDKKKKAQTKASIDQYVQFCLTCGESVLAAKLCVWVVCNQSCGQVQISKVMCSLFALVAGHDKSCGVRRNKREHMHIQALNPDSV